MIVFYCLWFAVFVYALVLLRSAFSFRQHIKGEASDSPAATTMGFSIVVPFRNEAEALPALLRSLAELNYPADLLEIILVNDHSTDNGHELILRCSDIKPKVRVIHLPDTENGKKAALYLGITEASKDHIFTTDADCILPKNIFQWLNAYMVNKQACLVAGPVVYNGPKKNITSHYQIIENAGLVVLSAFGISQKRPFMANGANLCFKRSVFFEVNGYEGNLHIPGGDDEFLLEKVSRTYPDKIHFLYANEGLVKTPVQPDFAGFVEQRVRWASKARNRPNKGVFFLQLLIFLTFCTIPLSLAAPVWGIPLWAVFVAPAVKIGADLAFYHHIRTFFSLRINPVMQIYTSLLQLVWIPFIAIKTLKGTFDWKGRHYNT